VAEGGHEGQDLLAVICPASGFETPPGTGPAAIQAVPLPGQKCWGGMGQKGRGQFRSVVLFWCFLLPLWQFKMTRRGYEGKGGRFSTPHM